MVPQPSTAPREQRAIGLAHRAWQSDRPINNTLAVLHALAAGQTDDAQLTTWAQADPRNALPIAAELLVRLRASDMAPATSRPSTQGVQSQSDTVVASAPSASAEMDPRIALLLRKLETAAPLRLHLARLRRQFMQTLVAEGISPRRAETLYQAVRWSRPLADYRPVLRELAGRLVAAGDAYRLRHRYDEAALTYATTVRLLTDVVRDSPLPDVALLAAAELPKAMERLASLPSGTADASRIDEAIADLRAFRDAWLDISVEDLSLLPMMHDLAPAPAAQRRALGTMVASAGLLATGWLLALLCLALIAMVLATRRFGKVPCYWHYDGWAALIGPACIAVPTIALMILLGSGAVPFAWLFSFRSLGTVVLLPAVLLLTFMLGTALAVRPIEPADNGPVLSAQVLLGGVGFIAGAVGLMLLVSHWDQPGQAPASVLAFRRVGGLAGLASVPVVLAWVLLGWRRRRSLGMPAGVWARAGLAVAAPAMAAVLLAATVAMTMNRKADVLHETAFAAAAADPVAARMGDDWWERYFAAARSAVE